MSQPLTEKQKTAASLIAEGKTKKEAAEAVGVDIRTIQRWDKIPDFRSLSTANSFTLKPSIDTEGKIEIEPDQSLEITSNRVLLEIARMAFASVDNLLQLGNGEAVLKNHSDITPDTWSAVQQISFSKTGRVTIRMHDKTKSLTMLCRYLGIPSEFNACIAGLRKYGIVVYQDSIGRWGVKDLSNCDNN
jgi:hypothetical protein